MFRWRFRRSRPCLFTTWVFSLTWHADVGHIMHMVPCIAYFIFQICHLLSLDMLLCQCHLFSFFIIYVNHAMPSCLARHHIRESCNAILFSQSSYMWIVSCHIFSIMHVFHLSTMFIHSSTLPVHQPFESVMGKSGVKTRSSEQSVLPIDADFLLVTDSSSEEDSERDDQ